MFLSAKIQTQYYAFSAQDLSASRPSIGDTLVFSQTLLNEDGVYSTATGKYTAPCDGVYEFHSTLVSGQVRKGVWVEFKAGGLVFGRFNVLDYHYIISSSGSAIARLRKGTEIYLRVTDVSSGFRFEESTNYMNTFSGHLISH